MLSELEAEGPELDINDPLASQILAVETVHKAQTVAKAKEADVSVEDVLA